MRFSSKHLPGRDNPLSNKAKSVTLRQPKQQKPAGEAVIVPFYEPRPLLNLGQAFYGGGMAGASRIRFGLTLRLLGWCLVLVLVFHTVTSLLLVKVRTMQKESGELATVYLEMELSARQIIGLLLSYDVNRSTYEVLGQKRYLGYMAANLDAVEERLESVTRRFPQRSELWDRLHRSFQEADQLRWGSPLLPAETVQEWKNILSRIRHDLAQVMEARLVSIDQRARQAARTGIIGLLIALGVGVPGSLAIAWRLNRSLSAMRRGIRDFDRTGKAEPVRVRSTDELGELALAFNEMAQRLTREERMRTDFISMLSHEIRTPLTSIRESVNMLAEGVFGEVNEKQRGFLDLAGKESERLSGLLARLMQVTRLESGQLEIKPEPVDACELMRDTAQRLTSTALAKDVALDVKTPSRPCLVMADPENVGQALLNLAGNAVKFSPRGGLVTLVLDQKPEQARFRILDQGPGVPDKDKPHVFDKYYRGRSPGSAAEGAGLGLAITRRIVEAHKGRVWLADRPEGGSEFGFSLPLA